MGATQKQHLKTRLLLGAAPSSDEATAIATALDELDDDGLEEVSSILAAAAPLELRQVDVDSEGVKFSQYDQLQGLRSRMAVLLGVSNAWAGVLAVVDPDDESDSLLSSDDEDDD